MSERGLPEIERSLTEIKIDLATLRQEFRSHVEQMDETFHQALTEHELRESEQQRRLLATTLRTLLYGLAAVISAIIGALWWGVQFWLARP